MLKSQFSAIFANFRRKKCRFSLKPVLSSNFCENYVAVVWAKNAKNDLESITSVTGFWRAEDGDRVQADAPQRDDAVLQAERRAQWNHRQAGQKLSSRLGGGSTTPWASPAPRPSHFFRLFCWVHHLVNRGDRHLLAHVKARARTLSSLHM
jgi:hypothetical protein